MPQLQLNVLFSNGKAICFFPTTSLQTREEFELFLEREYEKFYPTDSVSIKNVQYLHVDKNNTPIKFELPSNWDDVISKSPVRSNIVEIIFGKHPMIFVELDNQPKQNIPQYEIVSPIPASSRKKQVYHSSIGNVATSLEFSTTSNSTTVDDEKVVIFEVDDDSIFDKPLAEKELEKKKQTLPQENPQPIADRKETPAATTASITPSTGNDKTVSESKQPSQDSPEIDFDEEIIFSDNEEQHVEKQLFPAEEPSAQKSQESDPMVIDDLSPLMDDILSQSNEEPVKMTDELNEALCTQAVDTLTRDETSQKEEVSKKVDQPEQYLSPSKQQSQILSTTPQKPSSQTNSVTTPKSSQEKKVAPVFTPKSSQEKKQQEQKSTSKSQEQKSVTTPKSSSQEKKSHATPKLSSQEKVTTPKSSSQEDNKSSSQEKKHTITTPKVSSQERQEKAQSSSQTTPKSSQDKKPASATKPSSASNENNSNNKQPVKQLTPKTPISILSKVKNFKTPNPSSQNPREQVVEKSKSTTKKRKRDQLSTLIAKKAIDSLSSSKTKNK